MLAGEASVYLKAAAHQPVHWQPWGVRAFDLARALSRPILLDIGAIWCHWCHVMDRNAMGNPVQAMSGLGSLEVVSSEVGRAVIIQLAAESARVGLALEYRVPRFNGAAGEQWADADRRETYEALDMMLAPASRTRRSWRASTAQDVVKGPRTEIDYMNGYVVPQGRERGVPTPVSTAVVEIMHEVEDGLCQPAPKNIGLVLRRAGL